MTKPAHIVVLGAQPEWLSGLRGPMIRDFLARGYRVTAIGAEENGPVRTALESWGARYEIVALQRAGMNVLADGKAMIQLYQTLRRLRPDLILAYTVKPVVYGMPTARMAGIKQRYAMITGRGYAFLEGAERSRRMARRLATNLYRFGLKFAHGVMFHNNDDRAMFLEERMIGKSTRTKRIWGSGIDLEEHRPVTLPAIRDGELRFLMIGRLLRDKGVREFAAAAAIVKRDYPGAQFRLVGPFDPSPNGITEDELAGWKKDGALELVGPLPDVREEVAAAHVVVLPSYAEGLPRSVLEGMAAGRPIITTRAPGCADTVVDGESGLLVSVRDEEGLARAMKTMIEQPQFVRDAGEKSLQLARKHFDVERVNESIAEFLGLGQNGEMPQLCASGTGKSNN